MNKKRIGLQKLWIILSGAFIGLVNGFLGGGGGMFCVPILQKLYALKTKEAHSTALVVMLPLSIVSSVIYLLNNNVDMFSLGLSGIGVLFGGIVGAVFLKKIKSKWIMLAFAIIMLAAGIKMVLPW
ncbi:MAG: TSUP family transporter [Christensenellales bacterium]